MNVYSLADPISKEIKYIGITKNKVEQRLKGHIKDSKTKLKHNKYLSRKEKWILDLDSKNLIPLIATLKAGLSTNEAEDLEKKLISQYKRISEGGVLYNIQEGGEYTGLKATPWNRGLRGCYSEEYIKNNREHQPNSKATYVWTKDGEFVGRWSSIRRLCDELKLDRRTVMRCLNANSSYFQTHKGLVFSHEDKMPVVYNNSHSNNCPTSTWNRSIIATKDNKSTEFKSVLAASEALGIRRTGISNVLIGRQKTTFGYTFKYANNGRTESTN